MTENILMSALMPHPPIIIPEVGGHELKKVEKTVSAMRELSAEIVGANPDTIVIITPHSAFNPRYFTVYTGEKLHGNFMKFAAPEAAFEFENDVELIEELQQTIKDDFGNLNRLEQGVPLDHGSGVPLYYLDKAGYNGKIVVINYTALDKNAHSMFGSKIAEACNKLERKIVFITSGDLSHRLKPGAPGGYNENAHKFDEIIEEAVKTGNYELIREISPELREQAGECGYNSLMVSMGLTNWKPIKNHIFAYEAPFGVGYLVAKL